MAPDPLVGSLVIPFIVAGVVVLSSAVYISKRASRRQDEPPSVPYFIPWLGSALSLGKDPDAFFQKARENYGDLFAIQAAGQRNYYATSMSDIAAIYKNSRAFAFTPIRIDIMPPIFGIPQAAIESGFTTEFFALSHRMLAVSKVGPLLDSVAVNAMQILDKLKETVPKEGSITIALDDFTQPAVFAAIALALWGPDFPAMESYKPMTEFDKYFPLLAARMPRFMTKKGDEARERVVDTIERYWKTPAAQNACDMMKEVMTIGQDLTPPLDLRVRAALANTGYWGAEGNLIWAFFWSLNYPLHTPDGLGPIVKEIDHARMAWANEHPSADITTKPADMLDFLNTASLPIVEATIQEALRLASSTFSIRQVQQDGAAVGTYTFLKGDKIICATRAVHLDENVYPEPELFKPERFLGSDAVAAKKHLLAFGGGVSLCEGRYLAVRSCKAIVALFLMHFDIRLDPAKPSKPELDMGRTGMGTLPPKAPTPVIITCRSVL